MRLAVTYTTEHMFDLSQLNSQQQEAVVHLGGPLLILAGAGSGKTRVLACRVAHLIESGVPPNRILLLTFTRRAAREMIARARRFTDRAAAGQVWGGTFHSVANRLLRRYGNAVGLPPNFTVIDSSDSADLMKLIAHEVGAVTERRFPKKETLASIYSRTVNTAMQLDEVVKQYYPWCLAELEGIREVCETYTKRKREHDVLDLDDLLLYSAAAIASRGVGDSIVGLYDHVLVDEYQDTNHTQADMVAGLTRKSRNLTVVGDDFQAIYSFRAATVKNLLEFPQRFPDATLVTLDQNYRSTTPILAVANAVIAEAKEGFPKHLWSERPGLERPRLITCADEDAQSDAVCRRVLELRDEGVPLRQQAVLFRAAYHSDRLELELSRRNIPFTKYGGLVYLERAHVKDTLAMLRILVNPHDALAWMRVFSMLEGVGPASARKLVDWLRPQGEDGDPLLKLLNTEPPVPKAAAEGVSTLRVAITAATNAKQGGAAEQVERVGEFLEKVFVRRYDDAAARIDDVKHLARIAQEYAELSRFLTEITLDPPHATQDLARPPHLDDDWLVLSTIHSAKGDEWEAVHVVSAADGAIPSDMAADREGIEEERRLFYVAITRAKRWLSVYFPLRWYVRRGATDDLHHYAQRTRFIPDSLTSLFDEEVAGELVSPDRDDQVKVGSSAVKSVDRLLMSLFSGGSKQA